MGEPWWRDSYDDDMVGWPSSLDRRLQAWMGMTDCCDGSTWLDYMGNLVMDIRLETWSMAVLCRDIMQEHL